tara:strand:+ start:343 stop:552 length:210 start_codon:yes stop_codon:yes gene_type:complete
VSQAILLFEKTTYNTISVIKASIYLLISPSHIRSPSIIIIPVELKALILSWVQPTPHKNNWYLICKELL